MSGLAQRLAARRALAVATLVVCAGVAACETRDARTITGGLSSTDSMAQHRTAREATGAMMLFQSPDSNVRLAVSAGDEITVHVNSVNCAAHGNVISISGVDTATLSASVCHDSGAVIRLGPLATSGDLIVSGNGPYGTGRFMVEGSSLPYTLRYDDAPTGDGDFDDAVISFTKGPGYLTCTPVVRGSPVTCTVSGPDVTVSGWLFTAVTGDTVMSAAVGNSWTGTAVANGEVMAAVAVQGVQRSDSLKASMVLSRRSWRWSSAQWSFVQAQTPTCYSMRPVAEDTVVFAWNVQKGTCLADRLTPTPSATATAHGFTVAQVLGGPNNGFWYVDAVSYRMETAWGWNPEITYTGTAYLLPSRSSDERLCRQKMNLPSGSPVSVNFYNYNATCKGTDPTILLAVVRSHEGMGGGSNNGHEAQGRLAAADSLNDPYYVLEPKIGRGLSQQGFTLNVLTDADLVNQRLVAGTDPNHQVVKNNGCWTGWEWSRVQNAYISRTFQGSYRCF